MNKLIFVTITFEGKELNTNLPIDKKDVEEKFGSSLTNFLNDTSSSRSYNFSLLTSGNEKFWPDLENKIFVAEKGRMFFICKINLFFLIMIILIFFLNEI